MAYHTIYHTFYGERLQKTELSVLGGLLSGCGWALASEIDEGAASWAGSGDLRGVGQGGEVGGWE